MRYPILLLALLFAGCVDPYARIQETEARRAQMTPEQQQMACRAALSQERTICPMAGPLEYSCDSAIANVTAYCYTLDQQTACGAATAEQQSLCRNAGPFDGRCAHGQKAVDVLCYGKR